MLQNILKSNPKKRVEYLFLFHAVFSAIAGVTAVVLPHLFEWFMIHHGEKLALRDNSDAEQKITHLVTRLYGALIVAQAWITWNVRKISEPEAKRALIQAYFVCFTLTTLALVRAQLTEGGGMNAWNWINILLFAFMASAYGWFSFVQPITVFEGLGKATA